MPNRSLLLYFHILNLQYAHFPIADLYLVLYLHIVYVLNIILIHFRHILHDILYILSKSLLVKQALLLRHHTTISYFNNFLRQSILFLFLSFCILIYLLLNILIKNYRKLIKLNIVNYLCLFMLGI